MSEGNHAPYGIVEKGCILSLDKPHKMCYTESEEGKNHQIPPTMRKSRAEVISGVARGNFILNTSAQSGEDAVSMRFFV